MSNNNCDQALEEAVKLIAEAASQIKYLRPEKFDDEEHERAFDDQVQSMDAFVAKHASK